jgi:hypothetical protein
MFCQFRARLPGCLNRGDKEPQFHEPTDRPAGLLARPSEKTTPLKVLKLEILKKIEINP